MNRIISAVIVLIGLAAPAWAGFDEGVAAYERGNYATALREFRPLAEQGDASAQFNLALMYKNGEGVPQDYAEAVRWYRRAAEQGYVSAQNNLALMYDSGEGVPQDYAQAMQWYREAAEQGYADAQYNLGNMYVNGQGVPQDSGQAARWFRKAAEQGIPSAQYNLGFMYDDGQGVPQDYIQAHKWYNLAASRAETGEVRERAAENRDIVAKLMTPAQVAEAQRLAREWRPRQRVVATSPSTVGPRTKYQSAQPDAEDTSDKRRRVARVQRGLASLGYYPGPVDGILGPKTHAAIRAFQAQEGRPVTGAISDGLEAALRSASVNPFDRFDTPGPRSIEKASSGSGFYVSGQGHILTNEHVVNGCVEVRIPPSVPVEIVAQDEASDLALLKSTPTKANAAAQFRGGRGIRPGDNIIVVGYPLPGFLASEAHVTTGTVSALAGPGDDRRLLQITAPVQPGNSGGPVLDAAGNVVGVVMAKLDAIRIARVTGDIPQNVNFAVSEGTARAFLDAQDVPYETAPSIDSLKPADVAAKARKFTVAVECWR